MPPVEPPVVEVLVDWIGPSKRGKPLLKDVMSPGTLSLLTAPVTGPEGVVDFGELKRHSSSRSQGGKAHLHSRGSSPR